MSSLKTLTPDYNHMMMHKSTGRLSERKKLIGILIHLFDPATKLLLEKYGVC